MSMEIFILGGDAKAARPTTILFLQENYGTGSHMPLGANSEHSSQRCNG